MKLLIEGWRGVNHSFALVNQSQILELAKRPAIELFHRDLPFAMGHWNAKAHGAGFAPEDAALLEALREPEDAVDAVYRICSPYRASARADSTPVVTFMVTEMGLQRKHLGEEALAGGDYTEGRRCVVTPTVWSRERLLEVGFEPEKVHVVPHGVDPRAFFPPSPHERALSRQNCGIREGEFVFLNVGAAMWNKGVDLILIAFARLKHAGRPVRLVLKDHRTLYSVSVDWMLQHVMQTHPGLIDGSVLEAIQTVPVNLDRQGMRLLYGLADCYLSPYRAEGFNLPVLEGIACGLPVIVTEGGACDDFVGPGLGLRVRSHLAELPPQEGEPPQRYREPEIDALVEAMDAMVQGRGGGIADYTVARADCLSRMTWGRAADQMLQVIGSCAG